MLSSVQQMVIECLLNARNLAKSTILVHEKLIIQAKLRNLLYKNVFKYVSKLLYSYVWKELSFILGKVGSSTCIFLAPLISQGNFSPSIVPFLTYNSRHLWSIFFLSAYKFGIQLNVELPYRLFLILVFGSKKCKQI